MSIYNDIWLKVEGIVKALPTVTANKLAVERRDEPNFLPLIDQLPEIIVAPRRGLFERVGAQTMGRPGQALLIFDIYVGMLVDDRPQDNPQAEMRINFREETRMALWKAKALGLEAIGECHTDYDPMPSGVAADPPSTDGSWQLFSFHIKTPRSTAILPTPLIEGGYLSGMTAGVVIGGEVWELGEWSSWIHTEPLDVTDSESERLMSEVDEDVEWVYRENIGDLTNRIIRLKGIFASGEMPLESGRVYQFELEAASGVVYTTQARVADIRQVAQSPTLETVEIDAVSTGAFIPAIA